MPDFVRNNLVLIVISVITGLPAALYSFTDHLGLGFVLADTIVGALLLALAAFWVWSAIVSLKRTTADLFSDLSLKAQWYQLCGTERIEIAARALVGTTVAVYALLVLSMPLTVVATAGWEVCGTLRGGCAPATCLQLEDARGRTTGATCHPVDASGFFHERSTQRLSYKPSAVRLSCGTDVYYAAVNLITDAVSECKHTINLNRVE